MILMQISLYPLGVQDISVPLSKFWDFLKKEHIYYKICPLSTAVWHEEDQWLHSKIFSIYKKIREEYKVVMITTITTGSFEEISKLIAFIE